MTEQEKLDYFAAAACTGILSGWHPDLRPPGPVYVANEAYEYAVAMLIESRRVRSKLMQPETAEERIRREEFEARAAANMRSVNPHLRGDGKS